MINRNTASLSEPELTRALAYAGFVLIAFEVTKSLIVKPIKTFYSHMTFGEGLPFKSYEQDVLARHKREFEACLLYLRDFMQAIDAEDMAAIQDLREHRNVLAHDLAGRLHTVKHEDFVPLLERADKALFKLSNYRAYMEVGNDPAFPDIDWKTAVGGEYFLFKRVLDNVRALEPDVRR